MNRLTFVISILAVLFLATFITSVMRRIRRIKDGVKPETIAQIRRDRDALYFTFSLVYFGLFFFGDQLGNLVSTFGHYGMLILVFGLMGMYEGTRGLLSLWERRHPWIETAKFPEQESRN
jgi:hypothetical protein